MNKKIIVCLSGGMDSTTVLTKAIREGYNCLCVGFKYGSKHNEYENKAARKVADYFDVKFELLDLSNIMENFKSALMKSSSSAIPEGHYEDSSMAQTVVPGRNIIFCSILSGYAWSVGASEVWVGIHRGDRAIYPDCRPMFFHAMNLAIVSGTDERVFLRAPYLLQNKIEIVKDGIDMKAPYYLTRTCYQDQPVSCGKCGACSERLEAFRLNNIEDPIEYESTEIVEKK